MNKFIKPGLGLLLMCVLCFVLDPQKVLNILLKSNFNWFLPAVICSIVANLICAYRWQVISSHLNVRMSSRFAIALYGQGLAINTLLPGGVLGGDLWRAIRLSESAPAGLKNAGIASVFLDRVSGFWGLAWASLVGLILWFATTHSLSYQIQGLVFIIMISLIFILILPFSLSRMVKPVIFRILRTVHTKFIRIVFQAFLKVATASPVLLTTLPHSLAAQIFTQLSLWGCLTAVGLEIPPLLLIGLSSGILLAGALPVAIAGFGPREIGVREC